MDRVTMQALIMITVGGVLCIGSLILLFTQKFVKTEEGKIEIELPIIGRLKTNKPAIAVAFLGVALMLITFDKCSKIPETFEVSGIVELPGAQNHEGTLIHIVPGQYKGETDSHGKFQFQFPRIDKNYTGIAIHRDSSKVLSYTSFVELTKDGKSGTFNAQLKE
jgi:hypothetical protein